ncbi:MAG: helix-turn-helix transcriptional regulator [Flavobacteriales bacterium]|nr:helix-turn-helix transcriptional regulator [Flavobacteriales bacterium]
MNQQGFIKVLQHQALENWGECSCVESSVTLFEKNESNAPLSIKLVTKGTERYKISDSYYKLDQGEFIIIGQGQQIETTVKSKEPTKGICIYPPISMIQDVFNGFGKPFEKQLSQEFENDFFHLTTSKYRLQSPIATSKFLNQYIPMLLNQSEKDEVWWQSFYLNLAEHIAFDQYKINHVLCGLNVAKKPTKEELYRRISKTRDYIHDHKFENIDLDELARISSLSKYHFLRSFKSIYQQSPYQYLLKLKLVEAKKLITHGYTFQETADKIGYSDAKNLRKKLRK